MLYTIKRIVIVLALVAMGGATATPADAQCTFQQPRKAKKITLSLVPAFVSCTEPCNFCGTEDPAPIPVPNTATGRGFPGCNPPQTFTEKIGSPPTGWMWGPSSEGTVSFGAAKNKIVDAILNPPNTADVDIKLKLRDIRYPSGELVNGIGQLRPVSRGTVQTRANGQMTVPDIAFPTFFFTVKDGHTSTRLTANLGMNQEQTSLPGCTVLELLQLELIDENGHPFARPGLFLTNIPVPTVTPPIPTSTAPTPTPTPRTRCCKAPNDGCVDLVTGSAGSAECSVTYGGTFDPDQTSVCNGATGHCEAAKTGTTNCCEFVSAGESRCIEGPDWDAPTCAAQYSGGVSTSGEACQLDGTCSP